MNYSTPIHLLKRIYRNSRWRVYNLLTRNQAVRQTRRMPTRDLIHGFKSDFSPFSTFRFHKGGDWDLNVIPIEDHIVYATLKAHFIDGQPWEETPHYKMEMEKMKAGACSLDTEEALMAMFLEWDDLYLSIQQHGHLSNRELYERKLIDNRLSLLDEITVNIARDGKVLLNSGWHRAVIAKLLGVENLTVRVLVTHRAYKP